MLSRVARRLAAARRALRERREAARVARRLAGTQEPSFTADYVSLHLETWTRLFAEHRGAADLAMLEVGSYEGRSALWFLENVLTGPGARLTCLDWFSPPVMEARFDHNLRDPLAAGRVEKLRGDSARLLPGLPEASFHLAYVDGSHRAADVLLDGLLVWPLLRTGGLLLFDDYLWEPERPAPERPQLGIDIFLKAVEGRGEVIHRGWQVAVRKRA